MRAKKQLLFIAAIMAFVVLSGTFARSKGEASDSSLFGSIQIAGSSTVYPVSVAVAEEFNRLHPGVEIAIQSTGTGGGFKNFFIPGKIAINDASREIKESERTASLENGIEPIELQVAIDGLTVVVNPNATWVDNITVEQLAHIWRPDGPAAKWSDVDASWPGEELELYGPTAASGTFDYFTDVIVGEEGASRDDFQKTEQDNTIVQAVSGSQYAMGYFGMAYYLENQDKVKALTVEGVLPSIESAKSGEYNPLSRPLYIYVSKKALEKPEVAEFVRFYILQTSTDLIKEVGYVPLTESEMKSNLATLEAAIKDIH